VYLDAGFHFAFYDSSAGRVPVLFRDTQRKLARVTDPSVGLTLRDRSALIAELLERLPVLERDLRSWQREISGMADQSRILPPPDSNPVHRALALGQQIYTSIPAPVLAFFAAPSQPPARIAHDSAALARFYSIRAAEEARVAAFERGIPSARVVILPDADHYVFRSHEADVLREMRAFIGGLRGTCRRGYAESFIYLVDGKPATCASAMAVPRNRIASVEVLKGAAAALHTGSTGDGVILIQTKRDP
jgi:hypothetical protein